jgi:hypothetical protein
MCVEIEQIAVNKLMQVFMPKTLNLVVSCSYIGRARNISAHGLGFKAPFSLGSFENEMTGEKHSSNLLFLEEENSLFCFSFLRLSKLFF